MVSKKERSGEFGSVLRDVLEHSLSGENPVWDAVMTLRSVVVGPGGHRWSDQFVRSALIVCVAEGFLSVRSWPAGFDPAAEVELSTAEALDAIDRGVSWELPTESSTQLRLTITDRGLAYLVKVLNQEARTGQEPADDRENAGQS